MGKDLNSVNDFNLVQTLELQKFISNNWKKWLYVFERKLSQKGDNLYKIRLHN